MAGLTEQTLALDPQLSDYLAAICADLDALLEQQSDVLPEGVWQQFRDALDLLSPGMVPATSEP